MLTHPILLAIRAVSAEFARRMYVPLVWSSAILLALLLGVLIWLVTISGWWWMALVPVILAALLFALLATLTGIVLTLLRPQQNKAQRLRVTSFVDALQASSETIATPKFIIFFRLLKDIVRPTKQSYVRELSDNATTLRTGFQDIIASFRKAQGVTSDPQHSDGLAIR
jgi:hypothetical protein